MQLQFLSKLSHVVFSTSFSNMCIAKISTSPNSTLCGLSLHYPQSPNHPIFSCSRLENSFEMSSHGNFRALTLSEKNATLLRDWLLLLKGFTYCIATFWLSCKIKKKNFGGNFYSNFYPPPHACGHNLYRFQNNSEHSFIDFKGM